MRRLLEIASAAAFLSAAWAGDAFSAARPLDAKEKKLVESAVRPALSDPKAVLDWRPWNGGSTVCGKVGFEYFSVAVSAQGGKIVGVGGRADVFRPGLGPITQARVAACEAAMR